MHKINMSSVLVYMPAEVVLLNDHVKNIQNVDVYTLPPFPFSLEFLFREIFKLATK